MQSSLHLIYLNIAVAVFFGLLVDNLMDKIFSENYKILRIFIQFTLSIFIIRGMVYLYNKFKIVLNIEESLFFVSIYFAVQQSLFSQISTIKIIA